MTYLAARTAASLALLTLSGSLPAHSQPAGGGAGPTLMPEALQVMCNASGAGAWKFGETGVPYSSRLENTLGMRVKLTPHMAPFDRAGPLATPWSGRLALVEYSGELVDEAAASAMLGALFAAAERAGWTRNAELEDVGGLPLYLMPLAGERVYAMPGDTDIVASFGRLGKQVTLSCGHKDLLKANAREAFGELPAGTPRPVAPELKLTSASSAADCDRPEVQREMLTVMDGRANEVMSQMMRRIKHTERLTEWKKWKLESSGKVGKDRLLQLTLDALDAASPGGDPLAGFALFPELLAVMDRLAAQAQGGDTAAACRSSFDMAAVFRKMESVSSGQWRALDAALEAEAKKVGVALD